jgi:hypothetical protein
MSQHITYVYTIKSKFHKVMEIRTHLRNSKIWTKKNKNILKYEAAKIMLNVSSAFTN